MDLDFAILADGVVLRPDGKMDIFGAAWDTIVASAVPAVHPQLTLAVRVLASRHEAEGPHDLTVVMQDADGAELARAHGEVGTLSPEQREAIPAGRQLGMGSVLNFQNVVFPRYGAYQLAILWDGNEARPALRVFVVPPPQPP
jgi:hypothetical protein